MLNLLGMCFQEDFFEVDLAALQQDVTHNNLLIFLSYLSIKEATLNIYIFESMLRIFTMLAHREQSICHIESNQSILRQHDKDPQHNDKNVHGLFGVFVCIFDSMLKIFITPSNRELSICDSVRKILSSMTKFCMVFFGVFVCFADIEAENRREYIYRGPWMLWTT